MVNDTFNVDPVYLRHENSNTAIDYMHWQIPLSRRFRALKFWFVLRSFGIQGLQRHIRNSVHLARKFELLLLEDKRFEVPVKCQLGTDLSSFPLLISYNLTNCFLLLFN